MSSIRLVRRGVRVSRQAIIRPLTRRLATHSQGVRRRGANDPDHPCADLPENDGPPDLWVWRRRFRGVSAGDVTSGAASAVLSTYRKDHRGRLRPGGRFQVGDADATIDKLTASRRNSTSASRMRPSSSGRWGRRSRRPGSCTVWRGGCARWWVLRAAVLHSVAGSSDRRRPRHPYRVDSRCRHRRQVHRRGHAESHPWHVCLFLLSSTDGVLKLTNWSDAVAGRTILIADSRSSADFSPGDEVRTSSGAGRRRRGSCWRSRCQGLTIPTRL